MTSSHSNRSRLFSTRRLVPALLVAAIMASSTQAFAIGRDDVVMLIASGGIGQLDINNFPLDTTVTGGVVSLQTDNIGCTATLGHPCFYVLNAVRVQMSNFTFSGQAVTEPILVVNGPLSVRDDGEGIVIPSGTAVLFAFTQGGARRSVNSTSPSGMVLQINTATQRMSMTGSFTGDRDGVHVDAVVIGSAVSPFSNLPPTARAGADQTVTCGGLAHLNGSGSTDPNNNLFIFAWSENGKTFALGPQVDVRLAPGQHTVTLAAIDRYGGQGTDTVVVTVSGDTTPPTFTSVPPALTISNCASPNIGQATATDSCGGTVTISNNAPAVFPLGNTTVTYTARDAAGNTATATQVVTATLQDDASCCPAGSNIIIGTSNNDTLNGTAGPDCIIGRGAQDRIFGNGGNDAISGGDGDDIIDGGAGDDTIFGGSGQDSITGGIGNDNLSGQDGDDVITAGDGNDTLNGGEGQDRLFGDTGNDVLFGLNGDDELHGGADNDVLNGGGIHDRCFGGTGVNTLINCERILPGP